MALVVTPGAADAVAYSDRAAALARAAIDVRGATFLAIAGETAEAQQEALLATAAAMIDAALIGSDRLAGDPLADDQAMALPLEDIALERGAIRANQLLAFHLAERKSLGEIGTPVANTANVKRKKIGEIEKEFFAPGAVVSASALPSLPDDVAGYLMPYLTSATAGYGMSDVVRGS